MEGYNSDLLLSNLPVKKRRYEIPCVVSIGIPSYLKEDDDVNQSHGEGRNKSPRIPLKNVMINYDDYPYSMPSE